MLKNSCAYILNRWQWKSDRCDVLVLSPSTSKVVLSRSPFTMLQIILCDCAKRLWKCFDVNLKKEEERLRIGFSNSYGSLRADKSEGCPAGASLGRRDTDWSEKTCVLPFISSMTLHKWLCTNKSSLFFLCNGNDMFLTESCWDELMQASLPAQGPTHHQCMSVSPRCPQALRIPLSSSLILPPPAPPSCAFKVSLILHPCSIYLTHMLKVQQCLL